MSHPFYAAHPGNNGGNNSGAGGNNNGQHHPLAAQGIQGHPALGGSGLGGLGANSPGSTTSTMRMGITTYYRTMSIDNKVTTIIIGPNGEPIKLPESLESLPKSDQFPGQRHRWNTNEEIASMLIAFDRHIEWLSKEVKIRPKSGSMLLYSRKKVRYRRDGYCWKKRKDGKTTREDHMKLKVQGMECIYGCYVHSAILPTFHRRCYWLLQNPDIVLVHYLNVPYPDDNKLIVSSNVSLWGEKKEWTKDELISQLKPMFFSEEEPDLNNELEISTAETVNSIVNQLMEKQRAARAESLSKKAPECSCPDSTNPDKPCPHYCNNTGGNGNNKTGGVPTDVSGSPRRSRSGRNMNRLNAGGLAAQHKRAQQTTQQPQPQQPRQQTNNNNNNAQGNNQNQYYKATEPAYYASYGHVSSTSDFEQQQQHHHQAAHHHRKQQQQVAAAAAAAQQQQVVVGPSHPGVKDSNSSKKSGSDLLHHHSLQPQGALHSHHLLLGSHSSPVASAVRTLSHLSDFGLNGAGSEGGYEPYFMSAESLLPEPIKTEEKPLLTPLLDFKSAFSDLEGGSIKSSELSFNEALDFEGPGSNSSGSSIGRVLPESPYTPHHTQVLVKDLQCSSSSSNHVSGGSSSSASSASSSSAAAAAAAAAHYPPHEGCFEPSHLGAPGIDSSFDILKDFSSDFGSYELGSSSSLGHPSRHHPVLLGGIKQQQQPQPQNQQQTQQQHPHPSNTAATSSSYENTCCFNWNFNNNNEKEDLKNRLMARGGVHSFHLLATSWRRVRLILRMDVS